MRFAIKLRNFPSDKMRYLRVNLMHAIIGNGPEGMVSEAYSYDYKNQLLFDNLDPDMLNIFSHGVAIDTALRINDNCFWLCFIAIIFLVFEPARNYPTRRQLEVFNRVELCLIPGIVLPFANGIFLLVL
ncbi:hypothetical protein NM208_g7902 [Fusarium decemcellulare]|uniref:Uncharacterized protein n=2 Tax=Fusarium decemcellulare TaxID=57161 RepID=A0ACC1S7F8_9HYPO|nr:hypothetical protein NM208_g11017 [Fusarium decemcellulare]KAJ3533619.1 hypothetical protein NM208_g7902 [Fusarium decemcellulare]